LHRQRENPAREGPAGGHLAAPIDQQGFDAGLPMVHNQAVELLLLLGLGIDDPFAARTSVRAPALVGFRPKFDQPVAMRIGGGKSSSRALAQCTFRTCCRSTKPRLASFSADSRTWTSGDGN
jgi:hypothetical protein